MTDYIQKKQEEEDLESARKISGKFLFGFKKSNESDNKKKREEELHESKVLDARNIITSQPQLEALSYYAVISEIAGEPVAMEIKDILERLNLSIKGVSREQAVVYSQGQQPKVIERYKGTEGEIQVRGE